MAEQIESARDILSAEQKVTVDALAYVCGGGYALSAGPDVIAAGQGIVTFSSGLREVDIDLAGKIRRSE